MPMICYLKVIIDTIYVVEYNKHMEKSLNFFGLNKTEEALYKVALSLGPASVQVLAKAAGVKRSTSYFAIENLIVKGFMHEIIKDKRKTIMAEEPEYLAKILKKEQDLLEEKKKAMAQIVPELKSLVHNLPNHSNVSYYEGKAGIWHIFEDILQEKKDIYWLGDFTAALKYLDFQELLDEFSKKRRQYGPTKSYVISDRHPLARKLWQLEDTDFREFRFLSDKEKLDSAVVIYGHKIALFSFEQIISGTILENKAIAKMMHLMFRVIWENSGQSPN